MATIKDVAKKAGVSVSTVSYALSGVRSVSDETRTRVLRTVEELNYHPNLLARGLINKRTKVIALLYPTISIDSLDDLQLEFIASVTNVTFQNDYGLLLFTHSVGEQEITRFIGQGLIDGVILMEVLRQDPRIDLMKRLGYPFSMIGHGDTNDGLHYVDGDFYSFFQECVRYLVELNHRHIAFLTTLIDYEHPQHNYIFDSIRGFRDAAAECGVEGIVNGCAPTPNHGYEATNLLLDQHPDLTAIITNSEMCYSGVFQALRDRGLSVPEDFSVISHMSNRSAERYTPKVTNFTPPTFEMGRLGAEFLIKELEGQPVECSQVILPLQFTERQTTGPCKLRK